MEALVVEIEELEGHPKGLALAKLLQVDEVVLEREHRSLLAVHKVFPESDLAQEVVGRPIEGEVVVSDVHVAVVVDPGGLDPARIELHFGDSTGT
jgi:hypothetical protein